MLGVAARADPTEVRAAYRRLLRSAHPDLSNGVIVENMAFGRFGFFPPGLDGQLNVVIYDSNETSSFESVVMITGDELLGELGWLTTA